MLPVIRVLSDGKPWARRVLIDAVLDKAEISSQQRRVLLGAGDSKAENRIGWAISDLVAAGAVVKPMRAVYEIAQTGHKLLESHSEGLTTAILRTVPAYVAHKAQVHGRSSSVAPTLAGIANEDTSNPIEQIEAGIDHIAADVGDALLARLLESHPDFFEEAVVKLLLAMGYGGAEQRGRRIGGTGDGGVDGVIDQDALGLERIYVQAKRYAEGNSIGRETIQAFIGALHGFGASRGVFITTSTFTQHARDYAAGIQSRVVLIDGKRLVSLMIKYRVGVQVKQSYDVVDIDEDFFE
nr:restriction endonuclease [Paeniglutamicibacter psychrophenolicus]